MNQYEQEQFDKDSAKGVAIGSLVQVSSYYKAQTGKFVVTEVWLEKLPRMYLRARGFKVMDHNDYLLKKPSPKKTVTFSVAEVTQVLTAQSIHESFEAKVKSAENWRDGLLKYI